MGGAGFSSRSEQTSFRESRHEILRSKFTGRRGDSFRSLITARLLGGEWFAFQATMSLEPISPETALDFYLADRENEVAEATLYSHRSRLGHFVRWCVDHEIENLNNLTGRRLQEFRLHRRGDGDLSVASEKTQMDSLRVFIRWLEQMEGAPQDLSTKVRSPSLTPVQNTRHVMLDSETSTKVLTTSKSTDTRRLNTSRSASSGIL